MTRRKMGTGTIQVQRNGTFMPVLPTVKGYQHRLPPAEKTKAAAERRLDAYLRDHPDWRAEVEQLAPRPIARRRAPSQKRKTTGRGVAVGVGQFLDAWEQGDFKQERVYLGQIEGYPGSTTNPDVVDQVIQVLTAQTRNGMRASKKVLKIQRIIELREAAARLRGVGQEAELRQYFIEHGKEWADARGVTWGAFRELGLPPALLAEAGIKP